MSFVFPTNASQVQAFAGALYGVQVGTITMAQVNADIAANGGLAATLNGYYAASFGGATTASVATTVATNLGLTGDALTSGAAYVEAQLNAAAPAARGQVISSIVNLFSNLASDATFGAAATAWNAKVAIAAAYTGATNVAVGTVVADSTVFTLTADSAGDDFTGTDANESFVAASVSRLQDADVLDGGLGTDTLTAKLNSTTAHDATINDIEILNFEVLGTSTLLANQFTGVEEINITGSAVLTLTNAAAGIEYSVAGDGAGLTLVQAGTDGTANSIAVTLGEGDLGTLTLGDTAGRDFETITLNVAGATSATLTEAGTPQFEGDSIVVTGSGTFELNIDDAVLGGDTTAGSEVAVEIDASGFDGEFTVDIGANETENTDAAEWTGVDVVKLTTDDTGTVANIINNLASGTVVEVYGTEAVDNTLTVDVRGTATDDTMTVRLAHATAGSSIDIAGLVADGIETLTIESTGTDSSTATVTNVIDDIAGLSTDARLIIAGDKAFTGTGVEATYTNITVTNTAGANLTVDAGGALTFTGGTGNDRLEFATVADLTAADTVAGGNGTDTLAFGAVPGALSAAQLARVSGFEVLEFEATNTMVAASTTVDLTDEEGLDTVYLNGTLTTAAAKILNLAVLDGFTLKMGAHTAGGSADDLDIQVENAANAGTNNTVNVIQTNATSSDYANAGFQVSNVENLVISLSGDSSGSSSGLGTDVVTISSILDTVLSSITVTSTNTTADTNSDSLVITAVNSTLVANVDATAMTGDFTFVDESAFIATGATVRGGSGVDTFTTGSGADVIYGNAGADVLKGMAGNDNIDGGAGVDSIYGGVGADILTGGAGIDTFFFADDDSSATAVDQIIDFTVGAADTTYDKLDFSTASTTHAVDKADIDVKGATAETDTTVTGTSIDGIVTFAGADAGNLDTFAEVLAAVELVVEAAEAGGDDSYVVGFEFSGNTYVAEYAVADATDTATLVNLVQLVGVTGVTAIDTTAAVNTIVIA